MTTETVNKQCDEKVRVDCAVAHTQWSESSIHRKSGVDPTVQCSEAHLCLSSIHSQTREEKFVLCGAMPRWSFPFHAREEELCGSECTVQRGTSLPVFAREEEWCGSECTVERGTSLPVFHSHSPEKKIRALMERCTAFAGLSHSMLEKKSGADPSALWSEAHVDWRKRSRRRVG